MLENNLIGLSERELIRCLGFGFGQLAV